MKKEDVTGVIVYLLILAIALVFGLTVLQKHAPESELNSAQYIMFIIGAIASGVIFNAILFELGHIAGAKAGGYTVIFVNILGVCFYKKENKLKLRFSGFDGLTGETKILPKESTKKTPNPNAYLLFGSLFFAIEIAIIMVLFTAFNQASMSVTLNNIGYFLLIVGVIGGMILVYNILPFKLDTITDGYRLTLVSNPKNKEAFNELLRVEHEIELGNKDVEIKIFDTITNFTADLNLNKVYVLLEKENYLDADKIIDSIIDAKNEIGEKVYIRAWSLKIFIKVMSSSLEDAQKYYNDNVPVQIRRMISEDVSMASIRAYILIAGLMDKSKSECILTLNHVYKAYKHTKKDRKNSELKFFNKALDKVVEAHPNWELQDYRLEE